MSKKNKAAIELGKLGAKARWKGRTAAERSEHGRRMVAARWAKRKEKAA